ncbi:MAG: hypothetical protein WAK67_16280, partial [Xanthobacteraceae bacterium]
WEGNEVAPRAGGEPAVTTESDGYSLWITHWLIGDRRYGHFTKRDRVRECPLSGVKRTSKFKCVTSAFDPKQTFLSAVLTTSSLIV